MGLHHPGDPWLWLREVSRVQGPGRPAVGVVRKWVRGGGEAWGVSGLGLSTCVQRPHPFATFGE